MAIAFGVFTDGASTTGTTLSWNRTVTGSNPYIVVGTIGDLTSDLITGVTDDTIAMSKLGVIQVPTDRFLTLWGLLNPTAGTKQIVVTASSSIFIAGASASYTGVSGVETGTTTNTAASPATSVTGTKTTVALNAWTFACFAEDNGGTISAGSGTVSRGTSSGTPLNLMDSNSDLSIGAHTLQGTGPAANWGVVIASLAPFVSTGGSGQLGRRVYVLP